jgi:hypothetical protein
MQMPQPFTACNAGTSMREVSECASGSIDRPLQRFFNRLAVP